MAGTTASQRAHQDTVERNWKITRPLDCQCHPFGKVRDWDGCKVDVLHDHPIVPVEEVTSGTRGALMLAFAHWKTYFCVST